MKDFEELAALDEQYEARKLAFAKTVPDYVEVTAAANYPIPPHIAHFLQCSEARVGYYLAKHLDVLEALVALPNDDAILELNRLDQELGAAMLAATYSFWWNWCDWWEMPFSVSVTHHRPDHAQLERWQPNRQRPN